MDTEKEIDKIMEKRELFKNNLANIIRIADNISSIAKDGINSYASPLQTRVEINKMIAEIQKYIAY